MPARCQPIADEIAGLESERRGLQDDLREAPPSGKGAIGAQISQLNHRISDAKARLDRCVHGKTALSAQLEGNATLTTTHPDAPGPFSSPIDVGLFFNAARTTVTVTNFSPITATFDTRAGENTCTISKLESDTGTYNNNGAVSAPISLFFDQSLDQSLPLPEIDSQLEITLTTDPPGTRVNAAGAVRLTGEGVFEQGFLDGSLGTLTIAGVINPRP